LTRKYTTSNTKTRRKRIYNDNNKRQRWGTYEKQLTLRK
jgi:hypothetical protein